MATLASMPCLRRSPSNTWGRTPPADAPAHSVLAPIATMSASEPRPGVAMARALHCQGAKPLFHRLTFSIARRININLMTCSFQDWPFKVGIGGNAGGGRFTDYPRNNYLVHSSPRPYGIPSGKKTPGRYIEHFSL